MGKSGPRAAPPPPRWLRGWRGNLAMALSLVVSLLVAELALRAGGPGTPQFYRPDPDVGWRPRPDVSGWVWGDPPVLVAMNHAGYRDIDHPLAKPPHTYRIVLLGNSMSEAVEVPLDDIYWRRLMPLLQGCRTDGATVEVLSFAVNGYGTAQEYLTLEKWALKYQPDLVLLAFFTGTDLADDSLALGRHEDRPYFALKDGQLELVRRPGDQPNFATHSRWLELRARTIDDIRLVQLFRRAARLLHDTIKYGLSTKARTEPPGLDNEVFLPPTAPDWIATWAVTEALIAAIADSAHSAGAAFAMTTLSNPLQVLPDLAERARISRNLGAPDLTYPDRRLAEFAAANSLVDVPLAPPLATYAAEHGVALHGVDPQVPIGHWNQTGHRVAAEYLARGLCEAMASGRLDAAPPAR